jgi:hypothetical protein
VQRQERRTALSIGLPVRPCEHLRVGRDLEQARLGLWQRQVAAGRPAEYGHDVSQSQAAAGNERLHFKRQMPKTLKPET